MTAVPPNASLHEGLGALASRYVDVASLPLRQANISAGPQQVNNGVAQSSQRSRTKKTEMAPSKLLEASNGERLDTGTASAPGSVNKELETVGAIDRTTHARR